MGKKTLVTIYILLSILLYLSCVGIFVATGSFFVSYMFAGNNLHNVSFSAALFIVQLILATILMMTGIKFGKQKELKPNVSNLDKAVFFISIIIFVAVLFI